MQAITPPKALIGSDAKAFLNEVKGTEFSDTPHGFACLMITVLEFFKNKSIPIATVIGGGYSNDKFELAKRHSLIFKATSMVFN